MRCGPHPISTSTSGVWRPVFLPSIQTSDQGTELTLTTQDAGSSGAPDTLTTGLAGAAAAGREIRLGRRAATGGAMAAVRSVPDAQAGIGTIQGLTAPAEIARTETPRDRPPPDAAAHT